MRVNPNLYTGISASIAQTEESLQTATSQLSTGKRVSIPSDDPLAFAGDVQSLAASSDVDAYTQNAASVLVQAQMADSALSGVVTSLNKAITLGTQGGNSTVSSAQRASLAEQVQDLVTTVVSEANTTSNGVALFGGTAGVSTAFVADSSSPNGYTYQGSSGSNTAQIGQALSVSTGVSGDQIFTSSSGNVLGALQAMVTALSSGSTADLSQAVAGVTAAVAHIGQVRAVYGGTVSEITTQQDYLAQEKVTLTSQQSSLTDVDTATAATNLTQAQTAHDAVLAMAAKILPTSLLNYLQN